MLRLVSLVSLFFLSTTTLVAADVPALRSLLQQNQYDQAIALGESLLQNQPADQDILFLTAYALQKQQQVEKASLLYQRLIELYPDLPEPRNNLAMILLQQEKYDEAADLLVDALNTHPSYATAYRNLKQIYQGIASEAYRRAVSEPDSEQRLVSGIRLDAISQLPPTTTTLQLAGASDPMVVTEARPATEKTDSQPAVTVTAMAEPMPEPLAAAKVEVVTTAESRVTPSATDSPNGQLDEAELPQRVLDWAKAWSGKDFDRYLDFYASDYRSRFASRAAWVAHRRSRVERPGNISVDITDVRVRTRSQNQVVIDFEQRYVSSNYSDRVIKRLVFQSASGEWKIVAERTLSVL